MMLKMTEFFGDKVAPDYILSEEQIQQKLIKYYTRKKIMDRRQQELSGPAEVEIRQSPIKEITFEQLNQFQFNKRPPIDAFINEDKY